MKPSSDRALRLGPLVEDRGTPHGEPPSGSGSPIALEFRLHDTVPVPSERRAGYSL